MIIRTSGPSPGAPSRASSRRVPRRQSFVRRLAAAQQLLAQVERRLGLWPAFAAAEFEAVLDGQALAERVQDDELHRLSEAA